MESGTRTRVKQEHNRFSSRAPPVDGGHVHDLATSQPRNNIGGWSAGLSQNTQVSITGQRPYSPTRTCPGMTSWSVTMSSSQQSLRSPPSSLSLHLPQTSRCYHGNQTPEIITRVQRSELRHRRLAPGPRTTDPCTEFENVNQRRFATARYGASASASWQNQLRSTERLRSQELKVTGPPCAENPWPFRGALAHTAPRRGPKLQ
ncbi:hypothetical protein SKAU_G00408870 [Synaphobranchus kaupii]|uniref:Uncharacterized protein n=1 Tax=Synaphobranchus kaupii TaxID=118154 RepID=A0A9Q1IB44_SYNKA|nr:hypothetical protein SKAU_G00408870 [Synaphobranchus kaupii]